MKKADERYRMAPNSESKWLTSCRCYSVNWKLRTARFDAFSVSKNAISFCSFYSSSDRARKDSCSRTDSVFFCSCTIGNTSNHSCSDDYTSVSHFCSSHKIEGSLYHEELSYQAPQLFLWRYRRKYTYSYDGWWWRWRWGSLLYYLKNYL